MHALALHRRPALALLSIAVASAVAMQQDAAIDADALPVLPVREVLRIGSADDAKPGFNAILGVDVDRDGQIYVYDSQDKRISVLARDGRPVRTIGRAGKGPGEFDRVGSFGVIGDTLWTFDAGDRRLTVFRRNGAVTSARTLETLDLVVGLQDGAIAFVSPRAMRSDGRLLSESSTILRDNGGSRYTERLRITHTARPADTVKVARVLFAISGRVDTIGWEPVPPLDAPVAPMPVSPAPGGGTQYGAYVEAGGIRYMIPQPPSDSYIRTSLSDGSALVMRRRATSARPSEFEMARFDLAGKPTHRVRFSYTPGRYAGAILDTFAMRVVDRGKPAPSRDAAFKAVRNAMPRYPDFASPIYSAWSANDSSLWLRREDNAGPRMRWIVIERTGRVRGVVAIPRTSRPAWARADTLLAVDTDEFGVPFVVRYLVQKPR